jgi:hypothetical protein
MIAKLFATLAIAAALTGTAAAHHKPGHQIPPGQMKKMYDPGVVVPDDVEFVCLVTTEVAGDPYSNVVYSEWLPRADAEAKANLGRSFIIYHPDLNTEEGCAGF